MAGRALVPLYAASAILTLGEGSFQLLTPPYMHDRDICLPAGAVGLRATFLIASIAFPLVYFVLTVAVQRRGGHLHSLHGRTETQQQAA